MLKVSGNEVTTGSSSLDTFYDDQSTDYDKPKDKKKKKKKDKERGIGSPESDKGKKKVHGDSRCCFLRRDSSLFPSCLLARDIMLL